MYIHWSLLLSLLTRNRWICHPPKTTLRRAAYRNAMHRTAHSVPCIKGFSWFAYNFLWHTLIAHKTRIAFMISANFPPHLSFGCFVFLFLMMLMLMPLWLLLVLGEILKEIWKLWWLVGWLIANFVVVFLVISFTFLFCLLARGWGEMSMICNNFLWRVKIFNFFSPTHTLGELHSLTLCETQVKRLFAISYCNVL